MLRLVIGRASSGKTTYVRNIAAESIASGKSVMMIVPEQFSLESERAIIELLGAKQAADIRLFSFSTLAESILDSYDKDRKPSVTDAAKSVIMSMALESVEDHLEIFGNCRKSKKNVNELLHMTDELIQCDASGDDIVAAAGSSGNNILIKKSQEIKLIAEAYEMLLTERFSDDRYMINNAAKIAAEHGIFKNFTVIFDEFSGFTAQENLLTAEILKQADDVFITQCADGIHDLSEGTGAFSYACTNIGKLISLANKNNVKISQPVILNRKPDRFCKPLLYLEKGIYTPDPDVFEDDAPEITVAAAKNPYDECEFAAVCAKKLVREKGIRYRDIVIVSRNDNYEKQMPFALKKYDIPVFEDRRRSLENEIIVIFALCALSIAVEGFSTEKIMRYLKTFLSGTDDDSISEVENYVLMWQIDRSSWLRDWTGHPDGFGAKFDDDAEQRLEQLNEIRKSIIFPILKLKEELAEKDGFGCTKALYDFLIETRADKNLLDFALGAGEELVSEFEQSWDEFMNVLSLLADTIGKRNISPERYLELFKIMISGSDIGSLPSGLDEITVGDADRIRVSDKKYLFILGANEGVFPAAASESFVITDNERRILLNNGLELGDINAERIKKERLRVYSTISIPTEGLIVSHSLNGFDSGTLAPSEIVSAIEKIVPRCRKVEISLTDPVDTVESYRSAFESAALHFSDNSDFSESVKKLVNEKDEYTDMMNAVSRAANNTPFVFENPEKSRALFGENMYINPSKVEEYHKCPFKYFCRYGLKVLPVNKAAFDPKQTGLLVHSVLERIFVKYGSRGIAEMSENDIRQAVSDETDAYISLYMSDKETMSGRVRYSVERSKKTITEILLRLTSEFSGSKFETRDVELKIAYDGEIKPYVVDIPDGGKAVLNGIVDRIDTMPSENSTGTFLRVIDYKTGSKEFKLEDIMSGLNIQMLVYLICLAENGKDRYGNIVPAGILYVPAKKGKNSLGRNADDAQIAKAKTLAGKMSGIVLEDAEVIYGMEESGGGFIIDAKIDSKGVIKGKTFDMHKFKLLHKAVDSAVADMACSLHKGKIEAVPIIDGNYTKTCEYCDYRSVCCRDDGGENKKIFKGDVWEELEAMYGE